MADHKQDGLASSGPSVGTDSYAAGVDGVGSKAIIKNVDMTEEMQQESIDIATAALDQFNIEKDIAAHVKREFDRKYGPTWHVVVGKNFGSYVTHGGLHPFLPICVNIGLKFNRNQTFYLLLYWAPRVSRMEILGWQAYRNDFSGTVRSPHAPFLDMPPNPNLDLCFAQAVGLRRSLVCD